MFRFINGRARDLMPHVTGEIGEALRAPGEHPLILLVPEQYTLEAELTVIDALSLPGSFRLQVLSPARLFSRVFQEAGKPQGTRIDERGRVMMIYAALKNLSRELIWYRGAQHKPGFAEMAVEQIKAFKQAGVTVEQLEEIASDSKEGPLQYKLHDLAQIWAAYDEALAGQFLDGEDEMCEALERAANAPFLAGAQIWAYGFEMISATLSRILLALHPLAREISVAIAVAAAGARDAHIYEPVRKSVARFQQAATAHGGACEWVNAPEIGEDGLAPDIGHLERELHCHSLKVSDKKPTAVQLAQLKNPMEEAMFAAALARHLARSRGWRWRDIAIGFDSLNDYGDALTRACTLYDVPLFLESSRPAGRHPAAQYMLTALKFILTGCLAEDAARLIRTGYAGLSDDEGDLLINYAVAQGIRGNRWKRPFTWGADEERATAEPLRERMMEPILALQEALRAAEDIGGQLQALWQLMEDVSAYARLERGCAELNERGMRIEANESGQVWNRLVETIEQMHLLVGARKLPSRDLLEMLTQSLMASSIKPLPQSGDAIEAGRLSRLRGYPVRALILLGMSDRRADADGGLFLPVERRELAARPDLWLPPDAADRQNLSAIDIKSALSLAREYVVVTYPGSDAEGAALSPGSLPNRMRAIFPNLPTRGGVGGGDENMRRLRLGAPRAALQRVAPELRKGEDGDPLALAAFAALESMEEYRKQAMGLRGALAHRVESPPLGGELARQLYHGPGSVSASRLERYAACPFQHFVRDGLRPRPVEPYEFTPQSQGIFLHDALERFMKEADASAWVDADATYQRMDEICESLLAPVMQGPLGDDPLMLAHGQRLRQIARRAAKVISGQFEGSEFTPCAIEVDFGELAPAVRVGEEEPLPLSGRIDRIDRWVTEDERWLRVVDYKTGHRSLNMASFYFGMQLQLMIYLAAALAWEGGKPAGVFYFRMEDPPIETFEQDPGAVEAERAQVMRLDGLIIEDRTVIDAMSPAADRVIRLSFNKDQTLSKTSRAFSEVEFHALIGYALKFAGRIADEIRRGATDIAPARQGEATPCEYCDYAALCQIDARLPGGGGRKLPKMTQAEALQRILEEMDVEMTEDNA